MRCYFLFLSSYKNKSYSHSSQENTSHPLVLHCSSLPPHNTNFSLSILTTSTTSLFSFGVIFPYQMAMVTTSSIGVILRPLSPIRHSSFPTTPSLHLRLNLKCLATKEDSPELLQFTRTKTETILHSFSLLPLLYTAALIPGDGAVKSAFEPFVEIVKSLNLPDWLVHWGHPANMAVVLFAMGGYGTYLGFRIRYSDDVEEKTTEP